MKKDLKALMPQTVAPVQRETSATVSRDGNAITPRAWIARPGGGLCWFDHVGLNCGTEVK
ncbi:MAG: anacyclamide/piricyclamide family prenylated cyclic peptide [Limnothrix sp. BL-A-16]